MMQLKKFGISALSGLAMFGAAMFSGDARAEIVVTDEVDNGETWELNFDGNVSDTYYAGLTATIELTFVDAYEATNGSETFNLWHFEAVITNTTDQVLFEEARISAFGFNTGGYCDDITDEGDCTSDPDWQEDLVGVGDANTAYDTRVIDNSTFTDDHGGSFPNMFGTLDVCFTSGNTCQGGTQAGVSFNPDTGTLSFVLAFAGSLVDNPSINLSKFGIRYQSINSEYYGLYDESGTGRITVPEPGALALMGFGLAGLVATRRRRRVLEG